MRWLLFSFLLLSRIGYAQQESSDAQRGANIVNNDPTIICLRKLSGDQRFGPLANKLPIVEVRDMTFEMLANQALPNKKEQGAIAEWINARKECVKAGDAYHQQNYPPQLTALLTGGENSAAGLAADLYNRKLTYGAFNKRRQEIADDVTNKVVALVQQIKAQHEAAQQAQDAEKAAQERDAAARKATLEQAQQSQQAQRDLEAQRARQQAELQAQQQAQQADAMRRQFAAQYLLNNMNKPPLFKPPPAPVTTNCSSFGNQINCTTR